MAAPRIARVATGPGRPPLGTRPRHTSRRHLHRRVRPRPGGTTGRPPRHHALAADGPVGGALPPGAGGRRRALHRPRRRRDQRRHRCGHRSVPAPGAARPRRGLRNPGRPEHGPATAPGGQPAPVRRAAGPGHGRRLPGPGPPVGNRPHGRGHHRGGTGEAGRPFQPDSREALPAAARDQPGSVAPQPEAGRGALLARGDQPSDRGHRFPRRPLVRGQSAPPLPQHTRHDAGCLPPRVRRGRRDFLPAATSPIVTPARSPRRSSVYGAARGDR
jgi:hypothetical protein